jgi:1-aminocyclopropane-1-carboxylate deaminase/D-cysteine desulfhydrase-like pyridoxal-dependent ACC family enzyme
MSDTVPLAAAFPLLGARLPREALAALPTPVRESHFDFEGSERLLFIKCDDKTGDLYGGNKVRKLEFLLHKARMKGCRRVATFGAVGSHHALATALYARKLGLACTCFLSHQKRSPAIPGTLNMHLQNDTEIVRFGGNYAQRIATLRTHLWGRDAWVIPAGGSSWLGAVGFVNAGLELALQVHAGELPPPDRLYVAAGTLGTVAGLAIGLALADLPTEIQAVRVTETSYSGENLLRQLIHKTVLMLRRIDPSIPQHLADRVNIKVRHSFFAGGYAQSDDATDFAVSFAQKNLGMKLEPTYTGKTMAALLADLRTERGAAGKNLFWNTYNSVPLTATAKTLSERRDLPVEFRSYFS